MSFFLFRCGYYAGKGLRVRKGVTEAEITAIKSAARLGFDSAELRRARQGNGYVWSAEVRHGPFRAALQGQTPALAVAKLTEYSDALREGVA